MKAAVDRARRLAVRAAATAPGRIARRFGEDGAANYAVLVAWNLLLAFFPIVLFLAAVLGLALGHAGLATRARFESVMLSQLPVQPQDTRDALDAIRQQPGVFFVIGLAGLMWSGSALFGAIEHAFDAIYRVPTRSFVRQKAMGVLMMLLFAVVAVLLIASSSALALLRSLPLVPDAVVAAAPFLAAAQPVVGIVAGLVLFAAMYYVVPNRRMALRYVWPGTLLAGVGFYVLSLLFPIYLGIAGRGMNQYGKTLSVLFVFMAWAYFVGLIVMLGAELNAVLLNPEGATRTGSESPGPPEPEPATVRPASIRGRAAWPGRGRRRRPSGPASG
jgi:membrane protein